MPQPLRIYKGHDANLDGSKLQQESTKLVERVRLGRVLSMLVEAYQKDRTWLQDFEDEELTISSDLHDVLMAYETYWGKSA
ncbi:MAG: hypothetical protein MK165_14395 [Pirellulaceae bacterium]|nr:hypothetical protein [Pirellulaceae bacterium]